MRRVYQTAAMGNMSQHVRDTDDPENDTDRRADDPDRTPEMILMTLIMIPIGPKSGADQYHVIPIAGLSILGAAILGADWPSDRGHDAG